MVHIKSKKLLSLNLPLLCPFHWLYSYTIEEHFYKRHYYVQLPLYMRRSIYLLRLYFPKPLSLYKYESTIYETNK